MQVPQQYDFRRGVFSLSWNHISSAENVKSSVTDNNGKSSESFLKAQVAVGSRLLQRDNKVPLYLLPIIFMTLIISLLDRSGVS